ncbi:PREDICTED: uncharacterized protein LOC109129200 [Camelina sativa]|uniref:Uncharacterized protein LOC109129200 n=1 Tax=Camelina sativa TaxID=90675 RepID=A0ABM1R0C6_CAMSA|nr:PREDICTED: uncharacterized protein LOC109129200 [Camelina sativa]
MVHAQSHYSFEVRQVRSRLFLIRHPRPRYLKKIRWKDRDEFLEEISKLKSVPEIISRIDDYLKQIKEEIRDLDLGGGVEMIIEIEKSRERGEHGKRRKKQKNPNFFFFFSAPNHLLTRSRSLSILKNPKKGSILLEKLGF